MTFVRLEYSKNQVNKAGHILSFPDMFNEQDFFWALQVLANWRGCHAYPINTFQATLRQKLKPIDPKAIVAQRLKRTPSIINKLQRFEGMKLARMQDIGGLRAVVSTVGKVRSLEAKYKTTKFPHEIISFKDYINKPKNDGYRSVHLIFCYSNIRAPEYAGLSIELQLRTKLQHAWATAVETMGTFLGQALKSGGGEIAWRDFFVSTSAALAIIEKTTPIPGFADRNRIDVFSEVAQKEEKLNVLQKLSGFAIAADKITTEKGQGAYHLVVLDSRNRTVSIRPFPISRLDDANKAYAEIEAKAKDGEPVEAVLVSAGPIDSLRRAYPNYFLDTQEFIAQIRKVIAEAESLKSDIT